MKNMNILITGGGGFIGSHLCRDLLEKGNRVTLIDRCFNANNQLLASCISNKMCSTITADICSTDILSLNLENFEFVIHAAGVLGVQKVIDNPLETLNVNIIGTANMLELMKKQKNLKRFIYFSTSEVYGSGTKSFSEEDAVSLSLKHIRGCYAISKFAGEAFVAAYSQASGVKTTSVRPFNVYGPFRYGTNAVTSILSKAIAGENIIIHGSGEQKRAWCYISDFIGAMNKLLLSEQQIKAINIGNNSEVITTLELAKKIIKISGSTSQIEFVKCDIGEIEERKPDISLLKNVLEFTPSVPLEQGIRNVYEWMQKQKRF